MAIEAYSPRSFVSALCLAITAGWLAGSGVARAGEPAAAPMSDHCHTPPAPSPFTRTTAAYALPDLALTDRTGQRFSLKSLAGGDQPVVLNFIFATCTTICPVMTATFSQTRAELGPDAEKVRMVSITIDPEHDTPSVLAAYAEKFDAPADWLFLTGPSPEIERVLKAFDAYTGTKLAHRPITVLRAPGSSEWIRLEGLGSGADLAREVRALSQANGTR